MRHQGALVLALIVAAGLALSIPTIHVVRAQSRPVVVIDYSHGQDINVQARAYHDPNFFGNLSEMGFEVIIAHGGLNSSLMENVDALILGSIYGEMNTFRDWELQCLESWFNEGNKFAWVAYDSDYPTHVEGTHYINMNMSTVLELFGSRLYGEPAHIADDTCNCGANYRAVANVTSNDLYVRPCVQSVDRVLMHGSTLLYGSNSTNPSRFESPIPLEQLTLPNVHPILYYSPTAFVEDWMPPAPIAHHENETDSFLACAIQTSAGPNGTDILVVSGGAPYGSYCPMFADEYHNYTLTGSIFVLQVVEFAMNYLSSVDYGTSLIAGGVVIAAIAVLVIVMESPRLKRQEPVE